MSTQRVIAVALALAGCIATPLPHPPTADPEEMTLREDGTAVVVLEGGAGAISPGGTDVRVTWVPGPSSVGLPERYEVSTDAEGAFSVRVRGLRSDHFFIEALLDGEDVFLVAVSGGPGDGVVVVAGLADRDEDGSPDDIDCAPDDPARSGRRC